MAIALHFRGVYWWNETITVISKGYLTNGSEGIRKHMSRFERLDRSWLTLREPWIFSNIETTLSRESSNVHGTNVHRLSPLRRHVFFASRGLSFVHRFLVKVDARTRKTSLMTLASKSCYESHWFHVGCYIMAETAMASDWGQNRSWHFVSSELLNPVENCSSRRRVPRFVVI